MYWSAASGASVKLQSHRPKTTGHRPHGNHQLIGKKVLWLLKVGVSCWMKLVAKRQHVSTFYFEGKYSQVRVCITLLKISLPLCASKGVFADKLDTPMQTPSNLLEIKAITRKYSVQHIHTIQWIPATTYQQVGKFTFPWACSYQSVADCSLGLCD